MIVLLPLLLLLALLPERTNLQESLTQNVAPKINWVNIGTGILPPSITITFKAKVETERPLVDPWLKFEVPFNLTTLGPPLWAAVEDCCNFSTMTFFPSKEVQGSISADGLKTLYVQLTGATYNSSLTYVLQLNPDAYLTKTGYSESMRLSIVSAALDNHITYAYNYAYMNFYGAEQPSNSLIMQDDTKDPNRVKVNQEIDSFLIVEFASSNAQRAVVQTLGDFKFTDDANTTCEVVADTARGLTAPLAGDVECGFWEALGPQKKKYLIFTWLKTPIPNRAFKFKFRLATPPTAGDHKLNVMAMARYYPYIYFQKQYFDIFSAESDPWATGYPTLHYSFNLDANNAEIPDDVGLFHVSRGFNKIFNSLKFGLRAEATINPLPAGKSHTLEVHLGDKDALVPLGYIYDNLELAAGFSKKKYEFKEGKLVISNIDFKSTTDYTISLKIGFLKQGALPNDQTRGLGLCILILDSTVLFKSRALMRPRFNVVHFNKHLYTVESVERTDAFKRKHRGYSAFRSGDPAALNSANDYLITSGKNGLRIGDSQQFWFQSSLGPNHFFYNKDLSNNHDSARTYVEVMTDPNSIVASSGAVWSDSSSNTNCKIYSSKYGVWTDSFTITEAQQVVDPNVIPTVTIQAPLIDIDFLGGCEVREHSIGIDKVTRMRMRLQDKPFEDTNSLQRSIRGVKAVFFDQASINSDAGINGNYFVFNSIDIKKYQVLKWKDSDAAILDAYVKLHLFAGVSTTDAEFPFPPNAAMMDNLYVLEDTDALFPVQMKFSAQHIWYEDKNLLPAAWSMVTNPADNWPNILSISGSFGTMPAATKSILVFFDFIDPLTVDEFGEVHCSVKGITATGCTLGHGANRVTESVFVNVQTNGGFLYSTSRFSNYLKIDVDPASVTSSTLMSVALPFTYFGGDALEKLINSYENEVPLNPSFVAVDENWNILGAVDFGSGSINYFLNIFNDTLVVPDILAQELQSSEVRKIDDTTPNNNPADAVWFEKAADDLLVGQKVSMTLKSTCSNCQVFLAKQDFGSSLICANWNFAKEETFAVDNGAVDARSLCHVVSYLEPENKVRRYCLHCPNVVTVGTPANDASALSFPITDFTLPDYVGLKWPVDMISVLSGPNVKRFMKPQTLNVEFKPNLLTLVTTELELVQLAHSVKVNINITTTNNLPGQGVIFFGITAGCEIALTILGENPTPPCSVWHDGLSKSYPCVYSISIGGLQIELSEELPKGVLMITMYGLSIKNVVLSDVCNFKVKSYLSSAKNPLIAIDETATGQFLKVTYLPAAASGSIQIKNLKGDHFQVTAFTNLQYSLEVGDRSVYQTDSLSLSLGAGKYETDTDPVWCIIRDNDSGKILPEYLQCQTDNLGLVRMDARKDLSFSTLRVDLSNVLVPIAEEPGSQAEYYINDGFLAFASSSTSWSSLQRIGQFLNPVLAKGELDVAGLRGDILLELVPDLQVNKTNVFYLVFSPHYLPQLTKFKVFVYLSMEGRAREELKIWNLAPRMLALTGWTENIPAGTKLTFTLIGIDNPNTDKIRKIQVLLGEENTYATFKQWGVASLLPANKFSSVELINLETVLYTNLVIREKTKITLNFLLTTEAVKGEYVAVVFNYLGDELVREFKPFCLLTRSNQFISIGEECYMMGNRLEIKLTALVEKNVLYTLIMDDIPNPDFGYREPEPISMMVLASDRYKIKASNNDQIVNFKKDQFVKKELTQLLNFVGLVDGKIQVPKGFYKAVEISPEVIDPTDSAYYSDQVSFQLGPVPSGYIVSNPIPLWGIDSFVGEIGALAGKFVIGSSRQTVLTTYAVQVKKNERSGNIYSELPLLRVEVVPSSVNLDALGAVNVYKGAFSLPIQIRPLNLPTSPEKFDVLYTVEYEGLETVALQQQFILSLEKPLAFVQFRAEDTLTATSATVTLKAVSPTSLFVPKTVALTITGTLPSGPPTVTVGLDTASNFTATIKVNSNQEVFLYYYVAPTRIYQSPSREVINSQLREGITIIGDTQIKSVTVSVPGTDILSIMDNLMTQTNYTLKYFYDSPSGNGDGEGEVNFSTLSSGVKDGIVDLTFEEPVYYDNRQKVLCILAKKFSLAYENLYSSDGLNCETELIPPFVLAWHQFRETAKANSTNSTDNSTNSTNSTSNSTNSTSTSRRRRRRLQRVLRETGMDEYFKSNKWKQARVLQEEDILASISKMDIFVFQSRRRGQNADSYNKFFLASIDPGAQNLFSFYLNGVAKLTSIGALADFDPAVPAISGSPGITQEDLVLTFKNLTLSRPGHVYAVIQSAKEFPENPSKLDIRNQTKFERGSYTYVYETGTFDIVFLSVRPLTDYKMAYFSTNQDPRAEAASSEIIYFDFTSLAAGSRLPSLILLLFVLLVAVVQDQVVYEQVDGLVSNQVRGFWTFIKPFFSLDYHQSFWQKRGKLASEYSPNLKINNVI